MNKEISKTYNPKDSEIKWEQYWEENNFFTPDVNSDKPKYSIVIPPPNVTGNLHVGHILDNTIPDIYSRWKRMSGYNVLWLPGTDHAGIATQTVVEKHLREQNLTRYNLGREKFVEKVWEWKEVYHKNIKSQLIRMGASVDWSRERFTMDEGLSLAVRKVFVHLYNKGLIYKGKRIINWDPVAQTALSDEEVIYKEKKDKLYFINYPLANDSRKFILIATTRPETMLGDTAVAVNPDDKRHLDLIGKKVIVPIAEREVSVISDKYVDMEFGTGALKITPAHDASDYELGEKHKLDKIQVIDHQGKMNDNAGKYSGLDRFEARKQIVEQLNSLGLIDRVEEYIHNIGYSERGEVIVEPYLSDQWFVSMKSLAEPALDAVLSGKISFYPERWIKVYEHWMRNIRDWCVSRQLWWGHRIPVWYNKKTGKIYCGMDAPKDADNWEQDPDVLDTWFSSWLWPFSTMGWPEKTKDLKVFFPTDFLSPGPDIIFFWVARMIVASLEFTGEIPFRDVYFHNIIRDEKGRKLSKSLGNSPDVIELMDKFGADGLRFTLFYIAPQGVDVYFSEEKCELGRNFANKIWNASRFLLMKKQEAGTVLKNNTAEDLFDRWILSRLNTTIRDYLNALKEYKLNEASKILHEFIWSDYCDWYIEVLKIKLNNEAGNSAQVLETALGIFENIIKLLHPIMPFITEELWQSMAPRNIGDSITISQFPVPQAGLISDETEKQITIVQDIVTAIRNLRSEINISPAARCTVRLACKDSLSEKLIGDLSEYVVHLAKLDKLEIAGQQSNGMSDFRSVGAVVGDYQIYLKVEGLIDIAKEKERLSKEINRMESFLQSIEKKLTNENFIQKALPEIIESERKKGEDTRSKLERLKIFYQSLAK